MNKVIEILRKIQSTSSKNEKIAIIKDNADNELFKDTLKFLFDGNIVTGLSGAKIKKELNKVNRVACLMRFENVMEYLKNNNTGTDIDIETVQQFINRQPVEHQEIYRQLVTKSLKLGCDEKSINKAIDGLIPTFNVMLGTPFEKVNIPKDSWFSLSKKLNGTRASLTKVVLKTRQGKVYTGLEHIIKDLLSMGLEDMFIDGELVYKNNEGLSDSEAFQKSCGIAMSKSEKKEELKLVIFDIFPLNEFYQGKSEETYKTRKLKLDKLDEQLKLNPTENIETVKRYYEGTDQSQIQVWLDYCEQNDIEGLMLNLDTTYECKRTKNLVKIKVFNEVDLRCINIEEGQGKNKGNLGAIVLAYKENTVNCGSGFSDEQREYYWNNPDEIIGKICTIKYKEKTKNKEGKESIQFPTLVCVRNQNDKTEPSYN